MPLQQIKTNQIRAGRSLVDWTQEELAQRAGLSKYSITNLEGEQTEPQRATIERIVEALELAGVEFIDDGVRLRKDNLVIIEGEGWYLRLLDDAHNTLRGRPGAELLTEFADESKSSPAVIEKIRQMRADGIRMRVMVREGDTNLMAPLKEYRWIPAKRFENYVSHIYGEKVAVCTEGNARAVVFRDPLLAKTRQHMFEIAWSLLPQPKTSTASERFA